MQRLRLHSLAALCLLASTAWALPEPHGPQARLGAAREGSRNAQLQQGCVLLDSAGPRFLAATAGARECAGADSICSRTQACHPSAAWLPHQHTRWPPEAGAAAQATFLPGQRTRGGWHQLWVSTSAAFPDEQQALALGYAEGWLTGERSGSCSGGWQCWSAAQREGVAVWVASEAPPWARGAPPSSSPTVPRCPCTLPAHRFPVRQSSLLLLLSCSRADPCAPPQRGGPPQPQRLRRAAALVCGRRLWLPRPCWRPHRHPPACCPLHAAPGLQACTLATATATRIAAHVLAHPQAGGAGCLDAPAGSSQRQQPVLGGHPPAAGASERWLCHPISAICADTLGACRFPHACLPAALLPCCPATLAPHACPALPALPPLQMDGMLAGYTARAEHERAAAAAQQAQRGSGTHGSGGGPAAPLRLPRLGLRDFLWMSAVGDLGDLREALCGSDAEAAGVPARGARGGRCWLAVSVGMGSMHAQRANANDLGCCRSCLFVRSFLPTRAHSLCRPVRPCSQVGAAEPARAGCRAALRWALQRGGAGHPRSDEPAARPLGVVRVACWAWATEQGPLPMPWAAGQAD